MNTNIKDTPFPDIKDVPFHELLANRQSDLVRQEVIRRYVKMVRKLAYNICGKHRSDCFDDILQVGYEALLESFDRFDASVNVKFISYAYKYVSGKMKVLLSSENIFGSRVYGSRSSLIKSAMEQLQTANGMATREEIIEKAKAKWTIGNTLNLNRTLLTMEAVNNMDSRGKGSSLKKARALRERDDDETNQYVFRIEEASDSSAEEGFNSVDTALDAAVIWGKIDKIRLTKKERYVFYEIIKNNRTYSMLSKEMGLTVERIRQLYNQAIKKIRAVVA